MNGRHWYQLWLSVRFGRITGGVRVSNWSSRPLAHSSLHQSPRIRPRITAQSLDPFIDISLSVCVPANAMLSVSAVQSSVQCCCNWNRPRIGGAWNGNRVVCGTASADGDDNDYQCLTYTAGEKKRELLDTVKARKLEHYGHITRKQGSCLEKEIMQGTMPGARRRGRPPTAWMGNIKTWTGLPEDSTWKSPSK